MLQPVLGEGFKQCCSLWRVLMVLQCLAAISPNLKQCCIAIREDSSVRETMPRGGWHCKTTNQPLEEPTSNRHEKKRKKIRRKYMRGGEGGGEWRSSSIMMNGSVFISEHWAISRNTVFVRLSWWHLEKASLNTSDMISDHSAKCHVTQL